MHSAAKTYLRYSSGYSPKVQPARIVEYTLCEVYNAHRQFVPVRKPGIFAPEKRSVPGLSPARLAGGLFIRVQRHFARLIRRVLQRARHGGTDSVAGRRIPAASTRARRNRKTGCALFPCPACQPIRMRARPSATSKAGVHGVMRIEGPASAASAGMGCTMSQQRIAGTV